MAINTNIYRENAEEYRSLPLQHEIAEHISFIPTSIPYPLKVCFNCIQMSSMVSFQLYRVEKRIQHPYLFVLGLMAGYHLHSHAPFLHSIAKIVKIARILHSTTAMYLSCINHTKKVYQLITQPFSFISVGYIHAVQARVSWRHLQGKTPPSLRIPFPLLAILVRRIEVVAHELQLSLYAFVKLIVCLIELKSSLSEKETDENIHDLFIQLREIYALYDIDNPDSLIEQLGHLEKEIQTVFGALGIHLFVPHILDRLKQIIHYVKNVQRNVSCAAFHLQQVTPCVNSYSRSLYQGQKPFSPL